MKLVGAAGVYVSTLTSPIDGSMVVYDLRKNQIHREATDYSLWLSRRSMMDPLTVKNEMYLLRSFLEFLSATSKQLDQVTDKTLEIYRDRELQAVLVSKKARGSIETSKRTVNAKLRRAYAWLKWLQETEVLDAWAIGPSGCRVTMYPASGAGRGSSISNGARSLPLLYLQVGAASKHLRRYVPSDLVRTDLANYFHATATSIYAAHRNTLILDIVNAVGLRRASVNSLTIDQFERMLVEGMQDSYIDVTPMRQKFRYRDSFEFPVSLALRIAEFIEHYRVPFLKKKGIGERRAKRRLFVSAKDGRPLSDRSITQIITEGLRELGAPVGASTHCFRAKFANEEIEREIEDRLEAGLDTSTASVTASVSLKMGHKNPNSLFPYVAHAQSRIARRKK